MFASLTQLSPPNELAISPFIHLASKNWPMCMRSKNKECFKKTTHSHYSLTLPPMNHCLIMPIVWAFRHGFLRLKRSTSNLLLIKFSCMTVVESEVNEASHLIHIGWEGLTPPRPIPSILTVGCGCIQWSTWKRHLVGCKVAIDQSKQLLLSSWLRAMDCYLAIDTHSQLLGCNRPMSIILTTII